MNESNEPNHPVNAFQRVRAIMDKPVRLPDPYTDSEMEALMWQPPLDTDFPNEGMQLPAEEIDPNQLQLI